MASFIEIHLQVTELWKKSYYFWIAPRMFYFVDVRFNIDNPYFEGMVNQIYPPGLQLNKANTSDTEAPILDLHLSISNGFVSSKIYDKLILI